MLTHCADTTFLDLVELDRYWDNIMAGSPLNYHGEAINPKNLSLWERMLGRGKAYDPVLDADQRKAMAAEVKTSGVIKPGPSAA